MNALITTCEENDIEQVNKLLEQGADATVGRDEKMIREYIQNQEDEDKRIDQLTLNFSNLLSGIA